VPPYDADQGWLIHAPGAVGEHLVYDVADYRVDTVIVTAAGLTRPLDGGDSHYQRKELLTIPG
jgi:hypothetical protein